LKKGRKIILHANPPHSASTSLDARLAAMTNYDILPGGVEK